MLSTTLHVWLLQAQAECDAKAQVVLLPQLSRALGKWWDFITLHQDTWHVTFTGLLIGDINLDWFRWYLPVFSTAVLFFPLHILSLEASL